MKFRKQSVGPVIVTDISLSTSPAQVHCRRQSATPTIILKRKDVKVQLGFLAVTGAKTSSEAQVEPTQQREGLITVNL